MLDFAIDFLLYIYLFILKMENNNDIPSILKSNLQTNRRSLKISVVHPTDESLTNV